MATQHLVWFKRYEVKDRNQLIKTITVGSQETTSNESSRYISSIKAQKVVHPVIVLEKFDKNFIVQPQKILPENILIDPSKKQLTK